MADQPANATRLVRAGVGVLAVSGHIHTAIEQVLQDDRMLLCSHEFAATLNSHQGAKAAADWVEAVGRHGPSVVGERPTRSRFSFLLALPFFAAVAVVALTY